MIIFFALLFLQTHQNLPIFWDNNPNNKPFPKNGVTSVKAFKMKNRNNISLDSSNPNQKRRYGRNSQATTLPSQSDLIAIFRVELFKIVYFTLAITSLRMIEMDIWENKNVEHSFQVIFSVQSTRVLLFFIFRFQPPGSHRIFGIILLDQNIYLLSLLPVSVSINSP